MELKAWLERPTKEGGRRIGSNKYMFSRNVAFEGEGSYNVKACEDRKVEQRCFE